LGRLSCRPESKRHVRATATAAVVPWWYDGGAMVVRWWCLTMHFISSRSSCPPARSTANVPGGSGGPMPYHGLDTLLILRSRRAFFFNCAAS